MRKVLLLGLILAPVFAVVGCDALDWALLDPEQKEAIDNVEAAKEEVKKTQAELEAVKLQLAAAKTDDEKKAAAAELALVEARVKAADAKVAASLEQLDLALKNTGGSNLEKVAGIAGAWFPWLAGIAGAIAGGYKTVRAAKDRGALKTAQGAVRVLATGVEEISKKTNDEKGVKREVGRAAERAGVGDFIDGALKDLGLFKKSA